MTSLFLRIYIVTFLVFLVLPLAVVVVSAFNAGPVLQFPPTAYTTSWFGRISPEFWQSLGLSLRLGLINMGLCTLIGVPMGLALARGGFAWQASLNVLCLSPLMVPSLVIAVSAFQFGLAVYDVTGFSYLGRETGILVGHLAAGLPFVIRAVIAGLTHSDASLEEAAAGLGAGFLEVFLRVTLPLLAPAIVSGAIFAFLASFEDLAIALFMGGTGATTLPTRIYATVEYNMSAEIMAISTVIIAASFVILVLIDRLMGFERMMRNTGGRL